MSISRSALPVVFLLFLCLFSSEQSEAAPPKKTRSGQQPGQPPAVNCDADNASSATESETTLETCQMQALPRDLKEKIMPPPPPPPLPHNPAQSQTKQPLGSKEPGKAITIETQLKQMSLTLKETGGPRVVNTKTNDALPFACSDSEDFLKQIEETKFEKYSSEIEPYTFESVVLPLSEDELVGLYNINAGIKVETEARHKVCFSISEKVNEGMRRLGKEPGKDNVFVRLSTRSPKDAAILDNRIQDTCRSALQTVQKEEWQSFAKKPDRYESSLFNQNLHATYIASTKLLAVKDGAGAIDLLKKSNRIRGDLEEAVKKLKHQDQTEGSNSDLSLIVREFGEFKVRREVRGFVHDGKLTALTQYNCLCYFPATVYEKHEIQEAVQHFMETVIPNIHFASSYVVDLVIMDDFTVKIIEINPFSTCADSGLFSWTKPDDQEILLGRKPFEFRLVESLPNKKWVLGNMNDEYKKLLSLLPDE